MGKAWNTSDTSGRKRGSLSQQRPIITHSLSEHAKLVGRGGRLPCIMAIAAIAGRPAPNGTAPVKTFKTRC